MATVVANKTLQLFLGVVHSHPYGMDTPSSADLSAMDDLLENNKI